MYARYSAHVTHRPALPARGASTREGTVRSVLERGCRCILGAGGKNSVGLGSRSEYRAGGESN